MLYKKIESVVFSCLALATVQDTYAARIYVKNWSSSPVTLTGFVVHPKQTPTIMQQLKKTKITINPGHDQQLTITYDETPYNNFSQMTMSYKLQEHIETETVYFPADNDEATSFYITDGGYNRFPYDIEHTEIRPS